jgi:hypothetical protein
MPSFEDLVAELACVHITDRKRVRAEIVAGHLVSSTLKERWHKTSERERQTLIRQSRDRIWAGYMKARMNEIAKPKEAAEEALLEEKAILEELLNP